MDKEREGETGEAGGGINTWIIPKIGWLQVAYYVANYVPLTWPHLEALKNGVDPFLTHFTMAFLA